MRTFIIHICFFLLTMSAHGQNTIVKVGLFITDPPVKAAISAKNDGFKVYGDGKHVITLKNKALLFLEVQGNRVAVKNYGKNYGSFDELEFKPDSPESTYALKALKPDWEERRYEGVLTAKVKGGRLLLISQVTMHQYIAGVVQSETGNGHRPEFYKAQAVISRTYALKHFNRFLNEGYNLCDRVNSQVYKTMGYNDTIRQAVAETEDIVIVDPDIQLITAAFHSNSGGYTANSEDVWSSPMSYLKSVEDPFSECMPHYEWELKVPKSKYLNYFKLFTEVDTLDRDTRKALFNLCPEEKQLYFFEQDSLVPLKSMRTYFGLKSTHFCVDTVNDSVLFVGRGFGHAVGLSQEGAMKMAELGYNYREILSHYYQNIHLISLSVIDFFRAEN